MVDDQAGTAQGRRFNSLVEHLVDYFILCLALMAEIQCIDQ